MVPELKAPVEAPVEVELIELNDAELDAVAGGHNASLVDVHIRDVCVGVNANVITRNSQATTDC